MFAHFPYKLWKFTSVADIVRFLNYVHFPPVSPSLSRLNRSKIIDFNQGLSSIQPESQRRSNGGDGGKEKNLFFGEQPVPWTLAPCHYAWQIFLRRDACPSLFVTFTRRAKEESKMSKNASNYNGASIRLNMRRRNNPRLTPNWYLISSATMCY